MKNSLIVLLCVFVFAFVAFGLHFSREQADGHFDAFARCLADEGAMMYGAQWCSHCQSEKKTFGSSFRFVPYVECPDDPQKCVAAGIRSYPTWIFPDGIRLVGEQGLQKLAVQSGCALLE